ncbi:DUF805 domain-containing protein [Streptomyces formicae]|uniref:DUF805 domain-containing protein n=1 Tax=Streptomyces formicae TaxID=1616117 RepID=A0ABY3WJ53_9ACTN|nr:DUF805 domain-containing protein [Streptomyces formicae]UNM12175.1 DUF805 domain-containing protein [Streptomyces formicae]
MNWYLEVLKKYAVFSGRARRKEYWMFTLFHVIALIVLMIVDFAAGTTPLIYGLYALATFLPSLGVTVRRLHDTDRSGWFIFIGAIPLVGFIILLVFLAGEGKPAENKHGANPKFATAA